jgi:predicted GNAT superfamily acetyltransferase
MDGLQSLSADDDLSALLPLNNRFAALASPLDAEGLRALAAMAFVMLAAPDRAAFLIALDQDAPYRNPNFAWFAGRHSRFVYVDRIMVDDAAQGTGIAARLYEELFAQARKAGHILVTCEVNAAPRNLRSERFHARMGFVEAGEAGLPSGKRVRYLERSL